MSKFFPFTEGGGGFLNKKFFSQSEHVSSQIWCQKFSPLLGGGGGGCPSTKIFFPSLNMYQAKSGVKNFSFYWGGGGPSTKIFFLVWTCIKPNLVSKIFPFTETGYPPRPENLRPGSPPWKSETGYPPKKIWDQVAPPRKSETRYPS